MNKLIITSTAVIALMFCACNGSSTQNGQTNSKDSSAIHGTRSSQTFDLDTTKLKSGETFYQCNMNPEVLSEKPGNCPKCGMELSKTKKQ